MHIAPIRHSNPAKPMAIPCNTTSITNLKNLSFYKYLRISLKLYEESIAENGETGNENHENSA
jgi:hypothetical protein